MIDLCYLFNANPFSLNLKDFNLATTFIISTNNLNSKDNKNIFKHLPFFWLL